jgi:SAM-dependent methyltransferase
MPTLSGHFQELVGRYHGPEGDRFALEELAPVAARFAPPGARVLEIGCGYGRNLVALATLPGVSITGCDPWWAELLRARNERLAKLPKEQAERIALVRQEDERLPFRDGSFDLVVLWQVLEHVFTLELKRRVVAEAVRVLKSGGHVLIETPNQWFPVDYHDNKMPLVHWLLPPAGREWVTWKVRGERYHPSEYLSFPACERLLRECPGVRSVRKATRFYFAPSFREAWSGLSGTQVGWKRAIFVALAPVHAVARLFGGSADPLLPSIRGVWRLDKA